jgi:isoleucyl-tRNA synthetase
MAPISPFFSDAVFRQLNEVTVRFGEQSIHHVHFPKADLNAIDTDLEERMQLAQDATSLVLSIRKKVNIKVRQPLQKVLIPVLTPTMKAQLEKVEDLLKAEVNVKEIEYLTETEGFINKKVKANFALLGKKLGPNMKAVSAALSAFNQHQIADLEKSGHVVLNANGTELEISLAEVEISADDIPGWSVASKGSLTVALDITLNEDLRMEGDARELVNRLQNIRKESGFELTDRILVQWSGSENIVNSFDRFKSYICAEILADSLSYDPSLQEGIDIEVNDVQLKVKVSKKQ